MTIHSQTSPVSQELYLCSATTAIGTRRTGTLWETPRPARPLSGAHRMMNCEETGSAYAKAELSDIVAKRSCNHLAVTGEAFASIIDIPALKSEILTALLYTSFPQILYVIANTGLTLYKCTFRHVARCAQDICSLLSLCQYLRMCGFGRSASVLSRPRDIRCRKFTTYWAEANANATSYAVCGTRKYAGAMLSLSALPSNFLLFGVAQKAGRCITDSIFLLRCPRIELPLI